MKCRNVHVTYDGLVAKRHDIVMFGSYGKNEDGTAKKDVNYLSNTEGVRTSLFQRLNVIKGELWYRINDGLPLLDKIKDKTYLDVHIAKIINDTPGVNQILKLESSLYVPSKSNNTEYSVIIEVLTIYGAVSLNYNTQV